jgi:hypothetical protein
MPKHSNGAPGKNIRLDPPQCCQHRIPVCLTQRESFTALTRNNIAQEPVSWPPTIRQT